MRTELTRITVTQLEMQSAMKERKQLLSNQLRGAPAAWELQIHIND
jgi:hypothetical protein